MPNTIPYIYAYTRIQGGYHIYVYNEYVVVN